MVMHTAVHTDHTRSRWNKGAAHRFGTYVDMKSGCMRDSETRGLMYSRKLLEWVDSVRYTLWAMV
jgi:hypothetical protein